ncbi:Srpk [Apiospora saccharicola]|uniref:non-specific serine/threonine protein kinase n=1 Tax=Apiospora saccharicola TaxID=335842 RepID=A0ABR1THK3_9PEZI
MTASLKRGAFLLCTKAPRVFRPRLLSRYSTQVSSPTKEYERLYELERYYDEESISKYRPGGYHPVRLHRQLRQRYRVVVKLGWGPSSTAWLAIDDKTSKYVAVKVGTGNADHANRDVLTQLTQSRPDNQGPKDKLKLFPTILDHFDIAGPNGTHPCIVTPPARCSVHAAQDKAAWGSGVFQLDVARSFTAQLVVATAFVHSRGYVHGGIHGRNLLLHSSSFLDGVSVEQLYEAYGDPRTKHEPIVRVGTKTPPTDPGVPSYLSRSTELAKPSHEFTLGEANLLLTDFGSAFRPSDKPRSKALLDHQHHPPESIFEPQSPLPFAGEIWTLGCVIFELVGHHLRSNPSWWVPDEEFIAQLVELQGIMPPEWWARWKERSDWFDDADRPLRNPASITSWDRWFEEFVQSPRRENGWGTMGADERKALLGLLKWMLAWKPGDRPDVMQVLEADWMTKWALPAYQKGLELQKSSSASSSLNRRWNTLDDDVDTLANGHRTEVITFS